VKNLLALLAAAVLTFAGIGWYLDWYHISSTSGTQGHRNVNIDVNSGKIVEDVHKGVQKVREEKAKHAEAQPAETKQAEVKKTDTKPVETNNPLFVIPNE